MTSPDSWRTLLPDDDPYFASEAKLRDSHVKRTASPHVLPSSQNAFDIDTYAAAKASSLVLNHDRMSTHSSDTVRTSFSSARSASSAMSMAGLGRSSMQSQDSARSDSWRSLLPDNDRFYASRHTTAPPLSQGPAASSVLASPSLSDRLDSPTSFDGKNHRSAFFALDAPRINHSILLNDPETAARRHASFSSVEPNNSKQFTETRNMLASMRDTSPKFGPIQSASETFPASALPTTSSSSCSSSRQARDPLDAPNMTPELSQSTAADDNDDDDARERDSWPTSRNGRRTAQGASSPASTGPLTPEAGQAPLSTPSMTAAPAAPKQETYDTRRAPSPSHVSETSDSVLEATHAGLLATTTTTTTKTTTSTRTHLVSDASDQLAPQQSRSEAGIGRDADAAGASCGDVENEDDDALPQSSPMRARNSSCSISTPISPPTLPFLERRPAPPETDLVIETERSHYTLVTRLPGFSLDCITLVTKRHSQDRTLHIIADRWDAEGGGHFERRITFPDKECDLVNVKAEFDGHTLRVRVPRRSTSRSFSSASSATF
ncbi:SHSP domain-containing protein [Pseudozyma hubeiensis]|nr:SHSP domain-containing protein [Pseudozyma hubeiensis]